MPNERHVGNEKRGVERQLLSFCLCSLRLLLGKEKSAGSNQLVCFPDPIIACDGKASSKQITGCVGEQLQKLRSSGGVIY